LTLPFALAGGVVAAFLNGGDVSLASLVGFLAVFGIAARNSILLLHGYQELQHAESGTRGADLVLRGAQERLAPTLMTALAVGLALLPLVILGSIPGQEIAHPVAVIILGGLVTSTLLNLLVLPVVYLRFGFTATSGIGSAGKPAPATREV
jgi:Cu/Ag efflux pump CusA